MAEQTSSSSTIAGAITIVGLGLVWVIVAGNFPSQEELFPTVPPAESVTVTFCAAHAGSHHSHVSAATFRGSPGESWR
jgi:hypothetical protein